MTDKQDPIANATRLLREAAEELRQAHTLSSDRNNWIGEPEAKAAYDEHMAAAQALEDWEAAVGAGGVQALQPEGGPPGSGGWQHHAETMERERDHWRERARTMEEHQRGTVWYWQGDGNDHPESMVNSLPVVIRADQLRALIASGVQALSAAPVEVADALADSQYLAGVSAGWNAANADDPNEALRKLHESRAGYLKPIRTAARALALSAAPAIGDELRDTLVAVSAAIAEQDDRTAQKMIREILEAFPTPQAEQSEAEADAQLLKFYGVTTAAELITAQARHIEKLQTKLPQTPSFAPQRVREG